MSTPLQAIEALHRAYVALTGQQIKLDIYGAREMDWARWQKLGFTMEDLILVIKTIKAGIRAGDRKPAALKFSNLMIGQPDRFEEDLALAKSAQRAAAPRARPAPQLRADGRELPATAAGARTEKEAGDVALAGLRKFREENK